MLVVVNTVSALVHLYSIGYMADDPHRPRFFAYLSLFTFAMLMLVTADNLVQLFFGWEGVGLAVLPADRLLVHEALGQRRRHQGLRRQPRRRLRLRARHLRRLLCCSARSTSTTIFAAGAGACRAQVIPLGSTWFDALTVICLLLFMGAMGKSAQFLLHTWLPDAMEGPTPVSALIHAATMVTAGVFMVARLSPLFELAPVALDGRDPHRRHHRLLRRDRRPRPERHQARHRLFDLLAARLHVRRRSASAPIRRGIFHLFTHAFFKALLFLGAGSVIHAMHHEQDMRKMGGLLEDAARSPTR